MWDKDVKWLKTIRGNEILQYKGYNYYKRRCSGIAIYWQCAGKQRFGCSTTIIQQNSSLFIQNFSHLHPPTKINDGKLSLSKIYNSQIMK